MQPLNPASPASPEHPTRIGPYHLTHVLGSGSVGTSYLGAGPAGERVVVKVTHPELASDPDFHVRFVRESASARGTDSPHTARVLAADPECETPWIATEYVDGISLERTVAGFGVLGTAALRILATGLARALEELHRNDLVHGDLNPRDVVLVDDGIRLVDFGGGRLATRLPDDVHDLAVDQVREGRAADVGTGTLVEPGTEGDEGDGTWGGPAGGAAEPRPGAGAAPEAEAEAQPEPREPGVPTGPAPRGAPVAGQPPAPTGPPVSVEPPDPTAEPVSVEPPEPTGEPVSVEPPEPTGEPVSVEPPAEEGGGRGADEAEVSGVGAAGADEAAEGGRAEPPRPARGCPLAHISYKAPEQVEGAMGDASSDMFALATVLVYAATGKNPFAAETDEGTAHRLTGDAPETHDLPVLLRTLVAACWNRTPESRPTSAQFAAALANSEPPDASRASWAEGDPAAGTAVAGAADQAASADAGASEAAGGKVVSGAGPAGTPAAPPGPSAGSAARPSSGGTAYPVAQGHAVPEGQAEPRLAPNRTGTFQLPGPEDVRRYEQGPAEERSGPGPTSDAASAAAAAAAVSAGEVSGGNAERTGTFTRRGRESTPARGGAAEASGHLGPEQPAGSAGPRTADGGAPETVVARWAGGQPTFGALPPCPQGLPPGPAEVSPDGSIIAVASYGAICLWNGNDGTHLGEFTGFRKSVNVVAFNADGTLMASGHEDRCVRVWDMVNMRPLGVLAGHAGTVSCLDFSLDGNFLVSGSGDRHVLLWDLRVGRSVVSFPGHEDMVLSVAFSPDGSTILSGSSDRSARMWRTDGTPVAMLADYETVAPMVSATAFNPLKPVMLTGDSNGVVRTWASDSGAEGPTFAGHHDLICDARFSADGSSLITAGWDGQVFVRDTIHYAPAAALRTGQARLRCASLTRDGHMIVASGAGAPVLVWRL